MQFSTLALISLLALASAATASDENQRSNKHLRRRQLVVSREILSRSLSSSADEDDDARRLSGDSISLSTSTSSSADEDDDDRRLWGRFYLNLHLYLHLE
jgi:hypothetical protein